MPARVITGNNYTIRKIVCIGSTVSETRTLNHGVPQGSILGPMLLNIYINDLPMVPKNGNLKSYVDDSKLLLSFSINEVNKFFFLILI